MALYKFRVIIIIISRVDQLSISVFSFFHRKCHSTASNPLLKIMQSKAANSFIKKFLFRRPSNWSCSSVVTKISFPDGLMIDALRTSLFIKRHNKQSIQKDNFGQNEISTHTNMQRYTKKQNYTKQLVLKLIRISYQESCSILKTYN